MTKPLFERNLVYPSDEYGRYNDFDGDIIEVTSALSDYWKMVVRNADYGDHTGWMRKVGDAVPEVGYKAHIRVYDAGGGWYPDNKITSWWGESPKP